MIQSIAAATKEERDFCYTQDDEIMAKAGYIGYLRGDYGRSGDEFWSNFFDGKDPGLKTDAFRQDLDQAVNTLRFDAKYRGILKSRVSTMKACYDIPDSAMGDAMGSFALRADTESYAYLLRLNPRRGEYDFYVYCYEREKLDRCLPPKEQRTEKKQDRAAYLVDEKYLLYLQEKSEGVTYVCANRLEPDEIYDGSITWEDMNESGIRGVFACARHLAIEDIGLDGVSVAAVSPSMLKMVEGIAPVLEKLELEIPDDPKAICFTNAANEVLFQVPDGSRVQFDFSKGNHRFSQKCEYIDPEHLRVGRDTFTFASLATLMEVDSGFVCPEPLCQNRTSAWNLSSGGYILVEDRYNGFDVTLYDSQTDLQAKEFYPDPDLGANGSRDRMLKESGRDSEALIRVPVAMVIREIREHKKELDEKISKEKKSEKKPDNIRHGR